MVVLRTSVIAFIVFTVMLGIIYPLAMTGIAQVAFPHEANGSIVIRDGKAVGSSLIGQPFSDPKYFWSRPSATTPFPYNAASSSGSNLGQNNPDLSKAIGERVSALRAVDPGNVEPIPFDLITSSGSGLDPHISPSAALYQVKRVARSRGVPEKDVYALLQSHTEERQLGLLGEARVNVLMLNLALDSRVQR
ncbi:MAG: potassium-transporting ATPase subunit KdpC [Nitrospirae bacterium]|nr:potassium-transporting ATPase subunit KdpC [Nitrospirota bacterium]MBF0591363.1 potassium-transporting ATPase subunit KdpC [Nitrospirota bacterium]